MRIIDFHMHPYLKDSENLRFYPNGDHPDEIQSRLIDSGHPCLRQHCQPGRKPVCVGSQ